MPTRTPVRRPSPWLVAIVAVSVVARTAVAWLRGAPILFPDEYIYTSLGRSIAESGKPLVRGHSAHFPALLEPLLTAPAWLVGDVGIAYRLVQTIGALAMSLAAIPVYLLARRLGLTTRVALVLAALAVLVPDLVFASFVSSEALAYPLLLTAVYAATRALVRPTRRSQLAFLAVAVLTALARTQFLVLVPVYVAAAVAVGLREGALKRTIREQRLLLSLFALAGIGVLATGPTRAVGVYRGLFEHHVDAGGVLHWGALDAMTLAYAAGWVVVPGALLGLWLAFARPRSRDELAFGAVAVALVAGLLAEASVLQASIPYANEIQERYVFYAAPLLVVAFATYASRGWPYRILHLALAVGLVLLSARLPLTTYARPATVSGSPVLYAVYWLSGHLGQPGNAAVVVAAAAAVMSAMAVVASRRPRIGTPIVLGLAVLATAATSSGAVAFEVSNTRTVTRLYLPRDPSWVDRAGVGDAALVHAWGGHRSASLQELFWNRSITRVLLLPGAWPFDAYHTQSLTVAGDGTLLVAGRPVDEPLVMDEFGSVVRLRGARVLRSGPTATLWVPAPRPRLALYAAGWSFDGWLGGFGRIDLWPAQPRGRIEGWFSTKLTVPSTGQRTTITLRLPGGKRSVELRPGAQRTLRIRVCGRGPWHASFRSNKFMVAGIRPVAARATRPVFEPSPSACRSAAAA